MSVENTEFVEDIEEVEDTELVEDTEEVEDTELVENTEEVEDTELVEDTEILEEDAQLHSETIVVASENDYTDVITGIYDRLTLISMILLVWFAMWVLRSWRTWMVKGER